MISAVLFDLDGTLLDSAPDLVATLNHLRSSLGLAEIPLADLRHSVSRGAIGLIRAGMPPCDDKTLVMWKEAFLNHYQYNSFVHSRPFDGVDKLLSELQHRDIPWGIVTNKMEYLSIPILEKMGWLASIAALICGDSVEHNKPHPEPVLAACKRMGVEPEKTLMVGDDPRDIEAGQRAGSRTAFALYGYSDQESHANITEGTNLINTPGEVLDLLAIQGVS